MKDEKKATSVDNQGGIVIYQTGRGDVKIGVRFVDETVWLAQQQMSELSRLFSRIMSFRICMEGRSLR